MYRSTKFTPEVIVQAAAMMQAKFAEISVEVDNDTTWNFSEDDGADEGFSMYRSDACTEASVVYRAGGRRYLGVRFSVSYGNPRASVSVEMPKRSEVEAVYSIFEFHLQVCQLPQTLIEKSENAAYRVFIGHGRSPLWRDLKDHLHDKHGYNVEAFETGPRGGLTVTDVLDQLGEDAGFAIIVMTGENESAAGTMHARENVIHETGLFQGILGLSKVVVLLEQGCEEFSNRAGVQYIPFAKGNIKEAFGDVVATIKREFG